MISLGCELPIHLIDWQQIFQYISAYGAYFALWAVLSAVTVYRREISCNRSYHEDEEESNSNIRERVKTSSAEVSSNSTIVCTQFDETELMTEELLESAGLYCSGRSISNFAELLWWGFDRYDYCDQEISINHLDADDLLDRVGHYASPELILATIIDFLTAWKKTKTTKGLKPLSFPSLYSSSFSHKNYGCDPFTRGMPSDVHVQIASFLHPRDVVKLACVSKSYHNITHDSNNITSTAIWKTLWHRDYAWIVLKWKIGKLALERSNCTEWTYSKHFYFLFGQSYLDYVLAGHNTFNSCLVGIHSNIYNITPFLFSHPGSPDTLMVHSGRNATCFFDDMGHSTGARKLAMSMCVVINRSAQIENDQCGLFPTNHTEVDDDENYPLPPRLVDGEDHLLKVRRRGAPTRTGNNYTSEGGGTLYQIQTRFFGEREQIRNRNARKYSDDPAILGHEVNTYFDPFTGEWRIWYTDTDLETIYLPAS